jgi:hypothetical protein
MKHKIKFNHDPKVSIFEAMNSESHIDIINDKLQDIVTYFMGSRENILPSEVAEMLLNNLTLDELVFLSTEFFLDGIISSSTSLPPSSPKLNT